MKRTMRAFDVCIVVASAFAAAACDARVSATMEGGSRVTGRPPVAVSVTAAAMADATDAIDVVGSLAPKHTAEVKSEVTGVVTAVYVTDWVTVRAGTLLARLDTTETEAVIEALRAAEAQALVFETRAARERDRALQLEQFGLVTTQVLDDAKTAFEAAQAATSAARAQIRTAEARLSKSFIRAPIDGVVAERRVNVGDRVENIGGGEPMFRIVDNRLLDLTVTVPSSRVGAIRTGQALPFATDAVPGRTFAGAVTFINPAVEATSRGAKVIATVQNAGGTLRAGLFARGRIVLSSRPHVLQVCREALQNWNVEAKTAELFVVIDGHAEKRTVSTGLVTGRFVEIVDKLSPGELVVTRGAFALRPGDRVTIGGTGAAAESEVKTGEGA
jgi:RND family efflux transporter MFP subunit